MRTMRGLAYVAGFYSCKASQALQGRLHHMWLANRRVPLECPQEAADLYQQCLSSEPAKRPTAMETVDIITRLPKSASKGAPVAAPKPAA